MQPDDVERRLRECLDKKAEAVGRAGEAFQATSLRSRIWLDEDLCERLDSGRQEHLFGVR